MTFTSNQTYAKEVGQVYGEYLATFESDTGQVHAELFRQGDEVIAYVSLGEDITLGSITDAYAGPLRRKAEEFHGRLRIIYTGV